MTGQRKSHMALKKVMERQLQFCEPVPEPATCEASCGAGNVECVSFPNCFNPGEGETCCSDGTYCESGYYCTDAGCCPNESSIDECGASEELSTLAPAAATATVDSFTSETEYTYTTYDYETDTFDTYTYTYDYYTYTDDYDTYTTDYYTYTDDYDTYTTDYYTYTDDVDSYTSDYFDTFTTTTHRTATSESSTTRSTPTVSAQSSSQPSAQPTGPIVVGNAESSAVGVRKPVELPLCALFMLLFLMFVI
ncbi:MAG: hypothetical protein M1820_008330 [Bogoriella megaspora]|nr:MAG: hypothetical protein M1820_008330 [Bogoriella megaspora]